MCRYLTSSYTRNIFVACVFILFNNDVFAQQQTDTVFADDTYDSSVVDVDSSIVEVVESWLPDTVFSNITGSAYPANNLSTRHIPDAIIDSLKKDEAFWYADRAKNEPQKKAQSQASEPGFFNKLVNAKWFQMLVWIIIILGFLSVLVWYLASSNISLFRSKPKQVDQEGDHLTSNIFEIDYKTEIDKALHTENYRLATRLLFLQLLKSMDEKNIINYQQDLTNLDYRMQLYGTHHAPIFNELVKFYEYTWYGKWKPASHQFGEIKNKFETFNGQL